VRVLADLIDDDDRGGSVADQFIEWLRRHPGSLREALDRVVPADTAPAIGISDWAWIDRLMEPDDSGVGGWFRDLIASARGDREELAQLELAASENKNHKRADALQRTRRTLDGRRVIDLFAQRGILPKYGFPVDVVELDVSQSNSGANLDLNLDLRLGILEFAPEAKIVASNRLWVSKGIKRVSGRLLPEYEWGVCAGCGVLRSQLAVPGMGPEEVFSDGCSHCGSEEFEPNRRGRFVIPMFGFVGDQAKEQPGETRPPREGHLETYFAEFDGPPPETELAELGGQPLPIRTSRRGWITVFNRGRTGHGFSYCSSCGHAADQVGRPTRSKDGLPPAHLTPRGTTHECRGKIRRIDLGHRFITNVLELQLPIHGLQWEPAVAALSAMHALIAAAPVVGVAQNDIGGSLSVGPGGAMTEVIFDEVPGGAGHTRFLKAHLFDLATGAIDRVSECTCGEETSCYGCLRSYRNQFDHDKLARKAAIEVLERLLSS
jgi:hypothetical protein